MGYRPRDYWPLVLAIDASTCQRPWAATSPEREYHHHSCPGVHGQDGAAVAGWSFQWLAQLSFAPDSWTAPHDQVRTGAGDGATRKAAEQIIAHASRLRRAGARGIPSSCSAGAASKVSPGPRFAKTALGWDRAAVRHPAQVARWTWLIIRAITQLRLGRPLARDHPRKWERRRHLARPTPSRVRRDFARLILITGTPASPPKPPKQAPAAPKAEPAPQLPGTT